MQIGDLTISEWSDTGSCRFWFGKGSRPPELYQRNYPNGLLRSTEFKPNYKYESHVPASPGWERIFARIIYEKTGIPHPTHGTGRTRQGQASAW